MSFFDDLWGGGTPLRLQGPESEAEYQRNMALGEDEFPSPAERAKKEINAAPPHKRKRLLKEYLLSLASRFDYDEEIDGPYHPEDPNI